MGRFLDRQIYDRGPGPSPHAPGDGLEPGATYFGTANALPDRTAGTVRVLIPALDTGHYYTAICPVALSPGVGDTVLITVDDRKFPWLVQVA